MSKGVSKTFGEAKSLVTDPFGSGAAKDAAKIQANAAKDANATQKYMFDQTRADAEPWRNAGVDALGQISSNMGDYTRDFTMADFNADPGYAFRLAEGQKAIERSAAAKGGLNSGATLKSLAKYGQNTASEEYANAYNRFNNDRTTRFNRLSSLAGIGQTANSGIANAGQNYANNVSANQIGVGNAQAAASVVGGNNMRNMLGQGAALYAMSDVRQKTDIRVENDEITNLLNNLAPLSFDYLSEEFGRGRHYGIMAQDLEKSEIGKGLIVETENGKMIDIRKACGVLLAVNAQLHKRISQLEEKAG